MVIFLSLFSTFLISTVLARELPPKADVARYVEENRPPPWLEDAHKWLSSYDDALGLGKKKPYAGAEVDLFDMDVIKRPRVSHKAEINFDKDISDITSDLNDFIRHVSKRIKTERSAKYLRDLVAAGSALRSLRRKNVSEDSMRKNLSEDQRLALRALENGGREYAERLVAKKKAKDFWDQISRTKA